MAETAGKWMCPTCEKQVETPYCPACGERRVEARELTLRALAYQLFNATTSIDGRLFSSLRQLVTRPGALTVAYVNGARKRYLGPFQLFLVANVVFVAVQSLAGMNVFSSPLDSHLHIQDWRAVAGPLVAAKVAVAHTTVAAYAPVFDRSVALHAKSLVILMTVPFMLLLPIVFFGKRRSFGVHVVFAVHVYTFLLFLFCVTLAIAAFSVLCGGSGLESARMDNVLTLLNVVAWTAYLYAAGGTVYGVVGAMRVFSAIALSVAIGGIAIGYRFALFLFTLYVT